jgi:hypothetical protein
VLNLFAEAAHAPQMSMRVDARLFNYIPGVIKQVTLHLCLLFLLVMLQR